MKHEAEPAPPVIGPIPAWRLLGIAAMILALYLALTWVSDDVELQPLLLGAALVGGAVIGALVARFKPAGAPARGRRKPSGNAAARSTVIGLAGTALILAQLLSADGMSWLLLGGTSFVVGGAASEWIRTRRRAS